MDLSTGKHIHQTREWILRNSPIPVGTVLGLILVLYQGSRLWRTGVWEVVRDRGVVWGRGGRRIVGAVLRDSGGQ